MDKRTLARFWKKVDKNAPGGCWVWVGYRNRKGYGGFFIAGPSRHCWLAHRVSWVIAHGMPWPTKNVLHRCDNPSCVNPSHLFLGSLADNNADMRSKGRVAHGIGHGHAKLTDKEVKELRRLYRSGMRQQALADSFGVSQATVSEAIRGKTWSHVI